MPSDLLDSLTQWWSTQLNWQTGAGLWVLASMAVGVGASWITWLLLRWDKRRSGRADDLLSRSIGLLLGWLLRVAWLAVPGYGALLLGLISPRLMGLNQVDWIGSFGSGMALAAASIAIILAAVLSYRRALPESQPPWPSFAAAIGGSARLLAEAGALQWHWAFYRSVAIEAVLSSGGARPLYLGTWLGAALVVLEAAASPMVWQDLRTPGRAERRLLRAALLLASSALYLVSRNFWLAWAVHAVVVILLEPRVASPDTQSEGNKKGSQRAT